MWLVLLLASGLLLAVRGTMWSQVEDTKGRSFWLTFIENYTERLNTALLRLYLSCDREANVTITYGENGRTLALPLPYPNTITEVNLNNFFGNETELEGSDAIGTEITRRSYHIVADQDITVYALSMEPFSSDAFLVYPEDVLADQYVTLGWPNMPSDSGLRALMPSEFAVVATTDGTELQMRPSAPINGRPDLAPIHVRLDRGEVFFGQAWDRLQDVSGTEIIADRPVAVFSGIARTGIPSEETRGRDVLIEQMLPVVNWGEEVILVPFHTVTSRSPYNSYARIVALEPGTRWAMNGVERGALNPGEVADFMISAPARITASGPILVAQYEHSVGTGGPTANISDNGDPFMMLAVPTEQFDTAYTFQSVSHRDFRAHFINIVVPSAAAGTVRLDFTPVVADFVPVPGTAYSYAQIAVLPGSHHITADEPFGLYAYGYGAAISYGYVGGMLFWKLLSRQEGTILCDRFTGYIHEQRISRDGLDSVYFDGASTNIDGVIAQVPGDSIRYSARLIDPYNDGVVNLKLALASRRVQTYRDSIPGFTIREAGMQSGGQPVPLDTVALFGEASFCRTIRLENYGGFFHTIDRLELDPYPGPVASIDPAFPLVLAPGEIRDISICFQGEIARDIDVGLRIADSCAERVIAVVPLVHRPDTLAPEIVLHRGPCDPDMEMEFSEGDRFFSGITEVRVDRAENCTMEFEPLGDSVPVWSTRMRLLRIDPRKDLIYQISVRDAVGNTRTFSDTIGGFTLAVLDRGGEEMAVRLDRDWNAGELPRLLIRCDSVELYNYGLRPLTVERGYLAANLRFSIPPAQFPLVIPPKSSVRLQVCLDGAVAGEQADTLALDWICGITELLAMKMMVQVPEGMGRDICDTRLGFVLSGPAKRTFLTTPVPNPISGDEAYVDLGLARDEVLRLELFDSRGNHAGTLLRDVQLPAGLHRISFGVADFAAGEYFCRLTTRTGESLVEKLVILP